ncbi:MAG: hypothetical protein MZV70_46135 [Desulfobacterales bacterium]|nr:hypothetical protein [Desulfobacterales bacterium]
MIVRVDKNLILKLVDQIRAQNQKPPGHRQQLSRRGRCWARWPTPPRPTSGC